MVDRPCQSTNCNFDLESEINASMSKRNSLTVNLFAQTEIMVVESIMVGTDTLSIHAYALVWSMLLYLD